MKILAPEWVIKLKCWCKLFFSDIFFLQFRVKYRAALIDNFITPKKGVMKKI